MHRKLIILIFAMLECGFSQESIQNTWVGPTNEYIRFGKDTLDWGYYGGSCKRPYSLENGKIRMIQHYREGFDTTQRTKVLTYLISRLTADSLVIIPETEQEKRDIHNSGLLALINADFIYDSNLVFDSIYFSSTGCMGTCPILEIAFNKYGDIRFFGERFTSKIGSFVGKLSQSWIERFTQLLKKNRIENILQNLKLVHDASSYEVRLCCNGRLKLMAGGLLPPFNSPLVDTLLNAYKEADLVKVKNVTFKK